jgi:hypothetical protein
LTEGESLGKEKFQTKTHNNGGQNPIWNESHSLSLHNMNADSWLEVRLYDKDVLKDDYIGVAQIKLGELLPHDRRGVNYYPLWKKGSLRQTTSEQIGQVGVGVVFNTTTGTTGMGTGYGTSGTGMTGTGLTGQQGYGTGTTGTGYGTGMTGQHGVGTTGYGTGTTGTGLTGQQGYGTTGTGVSSSVGTGYGGTGVGTSGSVGTGYGGPGTTGTGLTGSGHGGPGHL